MNTGRVTLAQVADWSVEALDDLDRGDSIDYTPQEARGACAAWAWLLGAGTEGAAFEAARDEVLSDGLIFSLMHRPVAQFMSAWRRLAWEDFRPDDDPEAWDLAVLDRARDLQAGLGGMAGQPCLVVAVRRRLKAGLPQPGRLGAG